MHPIERLRYVARAGDEDPVLIAEEAALALGALSFDRRALVPASRRLLEFHPACGPLWWVTARILVAEDVHEAVNKAVDDLAYDPTAEELAAIFHSAACVVTGTGRICLAGLSMRPDLEVRLVAERRGRRSALRSLGGGEDVEVYDPHELDEALSQSDIVLVEALVAGPSGCVLDASDGALAKAAGDSAVDLWVVAGAGRLLPASLFEAVLERVAPLRLDEDLEGLTALEPVEAWDGEFEEDEYQPKALVFVEAAAVKKVIGPNGAAAPLAALRHALCPAPVELLSPSKAK